MTRNPSLQETKTHPLLVDDDDDTRDLVALMLERDGHGVTPVASPVLAIDILAKYDDVVVLTDLDMPQMSGSALCRWSRRLRPEVPIVVITGGARIELADWRRDGVFEFLLKPIDRAVLRRVVARATAARRQEPSRRSAILSGRCSALVEGRPRPNRGTG